MFTGTVNKLIALLLAVLLVIAAAVSVFLAVKGKNLKNEIGEKTEALDDANARLNETSEKLEIAEKNLKSASEELTERAAAQEKAENALKDVQSQLETAGNELATLSTLHEETAANLEETKTQLETTGNELAALSTLQEETAADLEETKTQLETVSKELMNMTALQEETAASLEKTKAQLESKVSLQEETAESLEKTKTQLTAAGEELVGMTAIQEETAASLEETKTQLAAAGEKLDCMTALQEETERKLQRAATVVLESDMGPGTLEPAESYIKFENGENLKILADYTYTYAAGRPYRHFIFVENISDKNLQVASKSVVFDADSNQIASSEGAIFNLPAGCTGLISEYIYDLSSPVGFYKTTIITKENYNYPVSKELDITTEKSFNDVKVWVNNKSAAPIRQCKGTVLFYKDDKIVAFDTDFYGDVGYDIAPGFARYNTFTCGTEFDDYEVFFDVFSPALNSN